MIVTGKGRFAACWSTYFAFVQGRVTTEIVNVPKLRAAWGAAERLIGFSLLK
jgi:hypothetical protein